MGFIKKVKWPSLDALVERAERRKEMELKDTIEMMTSADYKERFKAEYYQLKIRHDKLKAMVDKWDANKLDFKPTCSRETYGFQLYMMDGYLDVLRMRAHLEGVKL